MTNKPTKSVLAKVSSAKAGVNKLTAVKKVKNASAVSVKPSKAKKISAPQLRLFQVATNIQTVVDSAYESFTVPTDGILPLIAGMRLLSQDSVLQQSPLWGLLPADFTQRTGFEGKSFRQAIAAAPGFDIYFCHAHPELESVYHNPWLQGETTHPNFLAYAREFLKAAKLSDVPLDSLTHSSLFATGHLIVASPTFWTNYLLFIEVALNEAFLNISEPSRIVLFNEQVPAGKFSYLYLIVARLLSHFLLIKGSAWKACKLVLPKDNDLNAHLRLLREMKDSAVVQQSRWLTACWANYRALYFSQTLGKAWIANNLLAVSPKSLKFGTASTGINYVYPRSVEGANV